MASEHNGAVVNVPQQYQSLVQEMSQATGLPQSVVAAQAQAESGFNASAVSPAGAEGWLQFLPSTYNTYSAQAGVAPGTEFNPADEAKVYEVFMKQLLKDEGGDVSKALAAYNAGEGNIAAGSGYAASILKAAGTGDTTVPGTGTSTDSLSIPGLGGISISGVTSGIINTVLKMLGLSDLKDMAQRLGLIILGFVLVIVGIHILSSGSKTTINMPNQSGGNERGTKRKSNNAVSEEAETTTKGVGAEEAIEAAAVA